MSRFVAILVSLCAFSLLAPAAQADAESKNTGKVTDLRRGEPPCC